jgi:predicted 2-oxoglutarate/Fe(II)-dependent dioxygenase YbiX
LLLNDEFEGGEFYLDNKPIKFKKGDLLEFDGHLLHEVKEITKGYREVLVIFSKKKLKVKKTLL